MRIKIDRLKEIREEKGLKQIDVAKVLNITQVQYSRYETGLRLMPIDKLAKLAEFYNTSIDYLLYKTDERKPYASSVMH